MRIALDIDDVLAGFASGLHDYFGEEIQPHNHWSKDEKSGELVNRSLTVEAHKKETWENHEFWLDLQPISLPCDINFNVACYITSSPKEMLHWRKLWIESNGFPNAPVFHSSEKHILMERLRIDTLIDDRMDTVKKVRDHKLKAIHFQPWYSTLKEEASIKSLTEVNF